MKRNGLNEQMKAVESGTITYTPLTLEMLEEFIKELSETAIPPAQPMQIHATKTFLESHDDELFLSLCNNYKIIGGSEAIDYAIERYNKLTNK